MRFSRTRYVTVCQQLLVTATVTAVGVTAAGVMTLDIVTPQADRSAVPSKPAGAPAAATGGSALVDGSTVTPSVREVSIAPTPRAAAQADPSAPDHAGVHTSADVVTNRAPEQHAPTVAGLPMAVLSPAQTVSGYATVGVTWAPQADLAEDAIVVQVRTEKDGTWSGWQRLAYHDEHAPDGDTAEGRQTRPGTDAIVVGDVDHVQMRAATATGEAPAGIQLALIDPGQDHLVAQAPAIDTAKIPTSDDGIESTEGDDAPIESTGPGSAVSTGSAGSAESMRTSAGQVSLSRMQVAPRPKIYTRAQWGANEKLREQNNTDYGTIETGFVHHTVNANDYTRDEVPAIIRGIYAYHVISRGWRDIGYNFLVDRFGRIWEGRYGGVNRPVIGAHTYGYNDVSFAMSAIGNFDIYDHGRGIPPKAMIHAYAKLFAWKLSKYNIRANDDSVLVKGHTLHAINGHRDVEQTACPGRYLYAKLPAIRKQARHIQLLAQEAAPPPPAKTTPSNRVGGRTRYNTAAALATRTFDPGVSKVYISAGSTFPDSLTGGVAAALGHDPVLLVKQHDVPAAVVNALQDLRPKDIEVLGGTSAVDDQVLQQLKGLTSGTVTRLAGVNRYYTAARVAKESFPQGADTAYVVSGQVFADALSAVPTAAATRAPILLTREQGLPRATASTLRQLGVDRIRVVGGPAAVSDTVVDRLRDLGAVTRVYGPDRYATNARTAGAFDASHPSTVYLANGANFPDALAAGAAAGGQGAPVLLTRAGSLPAVTRSALSALGSDQVLVIGGEDAVSARVLAAAESALSSTP